ncbi:methyl-accepting chemotaxis protein [Rhodoferax sp. U11-2br]|uniref:methyl-accepting chemotaxis protein n=1 Tax=Rhodoferax sp. U11-2br TaxID=2838878 RepID=UPI001BEB88FD|nr:methyl-accepting chemotaxis protein [Rhodoferax sp. U11-2br]MBT3068309.1 methyl-accepting chemotaxis protein [Rhodoferax sp. U11-2br]
MNTWKISKRLNLIIAVSVVVMLILVAINWLGLSKLHDLQNESQRRDQEAGRLLYETGLGAQAYRIVADTFINRQFDDAAKKWQAMSTRIEEALTYYAKVADTDQEKQWAKEARAVMDELRKLYTDSYVSMAQRDAPVSELAVVDDQIDKLIDKYEDLVGKGVASLQAESVEADEAFEAGVAATRMISIVSAALGGLVLVVLAILVSRSITGQLGMELNDAMQAAKQVAEGDLRRLPSLESANANSLAGALETMIKTLVTTVSRVRQGSEAVAIASAEIAQGNNDLSARTEQQASSLEQTAASMEELGSTVKQNAESAHQANQLALNASIVAAQGGEVVAQVVDTMKGINEASRKIGDIISVIDGIAFQTNILALNAAVEAARAGEQGRGFAVVASEVRSLAGRSAEAAKEIKTLISASVTRVEQGTELVDQAGETMTEVVSSIKRVTEIMGEISAASKEQSLGVNQVGEAVSHMDKTTQQNAALVEQMAAAASNLKSQAQDLVQTVAVFRLDGSTSGPAAPHHPVASPAQAAKLPGTKAAPRPATTAKPAPPSAPSKLLEQAVAKVKAPAKSEDGEWETF